MNAPKQLKNPATHPWLETSTGNRFTTAEVSLMTVSEVDTRGIWFVRERQAWEITEQQGESK
jgi:hypothetical protein